MKNPVSAVAILLAGGALQLAGCAANNIQAQWSDPEFAGHSLHGEKVLVVCDARETAIQRVCQDRMTARLAASGVVPVTSPDTDKLAADAAQANAAVMATARSSGAKAVWRSTVAPDATVGTPGPTVGIGVGGFGGGYGAGGVGAGVGVGVPVGPDRVETAYGANLVLTDIETGRVMWTSKVTTAASRDVNAQMDKLAQTGVEAAQKAGML
jgi:hypothetical protein